MKLIYLLAIDLYFSTHIFLANTGKIYSIILHEILGIITRQMLNIFSDLHCFEISLSHAIKSKVLFMCFKIMFFKSLTFAKFHCM